jgi:hypothetical protein
MQKSAHASYAAYNFTKRSSGWKELFEGERRKMERQPTALGIEGHKSLTLKVVTRMQSTVTDAKN